MEGGKINGRRRPIAPDTVGPRRAGQVHAAPGADTGRGWQVGDRVGEKEASVEAVCGDPAYGGTTVEWVEDPLGGASIAPLNHSAEGRGGLNAGLSNPPYAGFGGGRRLAKDWNLRTPSAENSRRRAVVKTTRTKGG